MTKYLQLSLVIVLMMTAQESYCQFNQGRFIAGGSFRFSASNHENAFTGGTTTSKSSSISLAPNVGYFVIDNLAVGASFGLSTGKSTQESSGSEYTISSTTIGPFVRYYLPMPVFFQAGALYGSSTLKSKTPTESESKFGVTQLGLAAGYAWLLNDFVALEPMLGYQTNTSKTKDTDNKTTDGTFYLSCAFTIYLGERK